MAISHVLSSPIADFTGTVTVFNSAGQTTTANATQIVRPSDWNSAHNQFSTFAGNTAGQSTMSGTNIVLAGGANITLSGNGSTVSVIAPTQTAFVLSNSNGLTFGTNGSTVTASHNGLTSQSNQAVSAANGSFTFQTLTLANSNGVSFSTGTQGLFATVATDYASSNHSHGNPTLNLTNLSGTTASNSAGLTLSLSAAAPGAVTLTNYATGNTTQSSSGTIAGSSVVLRGSGVVSAGISNGSYIVEGPALTSLSATGALSASSNGSTISLGVGTVTVSATSNTTQASSGTINLNAMVLAGQGVASVGVSNGSLVFSVPSGGGAGDGVNILAAGTQTAATTGTVLFNNSNGITFGMSNSSVITASHNGITQQSTQPVAVSGQNGSYAFSTLSFSNANGISFGTSAGSALTASHNGLTTARASNDAIGLNTAQTNVTWTVNSSGLSLNAAGYAGTATAVTGAASITLNSNGLSFNGTGLAGTGTTFNGTNASASMTLNTAGLRLDLSAAAGGAGDGYNILAAGTQTATTAGSVLFENSNGITFGMSGSTRITASHNGLTTARASNDAIGLNTAQTNVTWTVNSSGLSFNAAGYAGTGTAITGNASITLNSNGLSFNGTGLAGTGTTFAGANISASMTLNSAGLNLSASVAAPGAAAENNAINLLGANTAGNTTATGSTIGWSGVNLTLSGTNASQVVISAPATSSLVGAGGITVSTNGSTISISNSAVMNNFRAFEKGNNTSFSSFGQNTAYFQHFIPEDVVQFSNIELWARGSFVSSTNSQAYSQTIRYGLYSQETGASSTRMSLAGSSSMSFGVSYNSNTAAGFTVGDGVTSFTTTSGGTGILANISGPFHLYMPFTSTLQPNVKHAIAVHVSSTTAVGTSPWRFAPMVQTVMNSLSMGRIFNSATLATATSVIGDREMGVYTATTGTLPVSYATSNISIAVSRQQLPFMLE